MAFVTLCFLGSWFPASVLRLFGVLPATGALGTRLFAATLLYAATMGWQPLVATLFVRRWVEAPGQADLGLRPAAPRFSFAGGLGALALAGVASLLTLAVTLAVGDEPRPPVEAARGVPSPGDAVVLLLALLGTLALVWVQAFSEEVGWRGYFLPRAMEALGRWRGLIVHGLVWGLWYAPVLFFALYGSGHLPDNLGRSVGFVVSCTLLGMLLGWLRLASGSLVPVVVANSTLTLAAGWPFVVEGVDPGVRSAVFGPAGWLVASGVLLALWFTKWRETVRLPTPASPVLLVLSSEERVLH